MATLAEEGYAELAESTADRRGKLVSLTPEGTTYAQGVVGELLQLEARAVERMGEQRMGLWRMRNHTLFSEILGF